MSALFQVPAQQDVSENNQAIFNQLQKGLGFVPNLYAYYAKSDTALGDYLALQNRKTSLRNKEKEVVNLVTSQVNGCQYCLAAHTMLGKNAGFTEEQTVEIRQGAAPFDAQLNALAAFTKATVEQRGQTSTAEKVALLDAGYTEKNLVDIIMLIGDKTISNYIHNTTALPIDFPLAPALPALAG